MRTKLLLLGSAVAIASIAALAAQHRSDAAAGSPANHFMQLLHASCAERTADGQAAKSHVPQHLATMLELTADQQAEFDRKASEACATLARIHEGMMDVLTPDQKAKLHELHKAHGDSAVAAWFKKLHGGH